MPKFHFKKPASKKGKSINVGLYESPGALSHGPKRKNHDTKLEGSRTNVTSKYLTEYGHSHSDNEIDTEHGDGREPKKMHKTPPSVVHHVKRLMVKYGLHHLSAGKGHKHDDTRIKDNRRM